MSAVSSVMSVDRWFAFPIQSEGADFVSLEPDSFAHSILIVVFNISTCRI